jgi:hypothetical protein
MQSGRLYMHIPINTALRALCIADVGTAGSHRVSFQLENTKI